MESLSNPQPALTTEQRKEVMKIGIEFAFEDGLSVENYKRQYPHVPEQEELDAFLEGFNKAKMELNPDSNVVDEVKHLS